MKKKIVSLALSALLLVSCSSGNSSNAGGSNLTAESVKSAYNGADELKGKAFDKFSLPSDFNIADLENVYTIKYNTVPPQFDNEKLKELYKRYAGDTYDPNNLVSDGSFGLMYSGKKTGDISGIVYDGLISMKRIENYTGPMDEEITRQRYYVEGDRDSVITVNGQDTSIVQEAEIIDKKLNDLFQGFFDPFEIKTVFFEVESSGYITFNSAFSLDGVILQPFGTDYIKTIEGEGREFADVFIVGGQIDTKNEISLIFVQNIPTILEKQRQDSLISLKRAVGILQSELPDYSNFDFTDIRLMYCGLVINPRMSSIVNNAELDSQQQEVFRAEEKHLDPTWCFFLGTHQIEEGFRERCVKVNAVTGELFIDISEDNTGT